jgi:hypothetical protein
MIPVDAAHASLHYSPDRRFRGWIRPSVQITVTVLIPLLPEVQTEDRGKTETAKAIAMKGRLRLGRNALVYSLGSEELHKLSKCPDRTGPPSRRAWWL